MLLEIVGSGGLTASKKSLHCESHVRKVTESPDYDPMPKSSDTIRTAALRGRMSAAVPRITRQDVADATDYTESYVRAILSDKANTSDLSVALASLEEAVARLETRRRAVKEAA